MRHVLFIALLLAPAIGVADERMADVAGFINAVWFAEEFNEHCSKSPMEVPVSEAELRKLLVLADGGNFVDEVDREPANPDMSFRDFMKGLARDATVEGCDSDTALMMRSRLEKELNVPEVIKELQDSNEAN